MSCDNFAYYNEHDRFAASWLKNLVNAGAVPGGHIDERDIQSVRSGDLDRYKQCHFFAGIGGWPLALDLAGWPRDREVWTGSCPCQPFSPAGKGKAFDDPRHLWPIWLPLIAERRPSAIFGEQVASPAGRLWFARVRADLEALGYRVGAADLCAAGVGAPHARQRLYWAALRVGDTDSKGLQVGARISRNDETSPRPTSRQTAQQTGVVFGRMGNADRSGREPGKPEAETVGHRSAAVTTGHWGGYAIAEFEAGIRRRFEPGSFPLAHGIPGRVGRLRAYGNAIVPQIAAEFIIAAEEAAHSL